MKIDKLVHNIFNLGLIPTEKTGYIAKHEESIQKVRSIINCINVKYDDVKSYIEKSIDNSDYLYQLICSGKSWEEIKEVL